MQRAGLSSNQPAREGGDESIAWIRGDEEEEDEEKVSEKRGEHA